VFPRVDPLPTKEDLLDAQDKRWFADLTDEYSEQVPDERTWELSKRIVREGDVTRALARLLDHAQTSGGRTRPRDIAPVNGPRGGMRSGPNDRAGSFEQRLPRPSRFDNERPRFEGDRPARFENDRPRFESDRPRFDNGPARQDGPPRFDRGAQRSAPSNEPTDWVTFHVTWGETHGADPRRLVAMACRRGQIQGTDIGAIRVGRSSSTIDVASNVARDFGEAVAKPDPRDPRISFGRSPGAPPPREERAPREDRAPREEAPREERAEAAAPIIPVPRASKPRVSKVEPDRPSRPVAIRPDRPSKPAVRPDRPSKPATRPERSDRGGAKPYPAKPTKPFAGKGGKPPYVSKGKVDAKPEAKPARPVGDEQPPKRRREITSPTRPKRP
ncbi:hypothetical protein EON77_13210, partial [bacterium]